MRRAFEKIRVAPRAVDNPNRQHRLKGKQAPSKAGNWNVGNTTSPRIWYLLDDVNHIAWISYAGTGHPKATD
ncbi:hypothetical protein ACIBSV_05705 [Embleya sp. NPDC050154]|uniref:hypothetical protein n=1 Tax=Embleya sp. NPDC050154 TaxID=3363988 RepID=UPI0037908BAC